MRETVGPEEGRVAGDNGVVRPTPTTPSVRLKTRGPPLARHAPLRARPRHGVGPQPLTSRGRRPPVRGSRLVALAVRLRLLASDILLVTLAVRPGRGRVLTVVGLARKDVPRVPGLGRVRQGRVG